MVYTLIHKCVIIKFRHIRTMEQVCVTAPFKIMLKNKTDEYAYNIIFEETVQNHFTSVWAILQNYQNTMIDYKIFFFKLINNHQPCVDASRIIRRSGMDVYLIE